MRTFWMSVRFASIQMLKHTHAYMLPLFFCTSFQVLFAFVLAFFAFSSSLFHYKEHVVWPFILVYRQYSGINMFSEWLIFSPVSAFCDDLLSRTTLSLSFSLSATPFRSYSFPSLKYFSHETIESQKKSFSVFSQMNASNRSNDGHCRSFLFRSPPKILILFGPLVRFACFPTLAHIVSSREQKRIKNNT